jgi:hypothetical protein
MFDAEIFFSHIIYCTLAVKVAVFQLQAHAIIKTGQFILFFASSCFGFNCINNNYILSIYIIYKKMDILQSKIYFIVKKILKLVIFNYK